MGNKFFIVQRAPLQLFTRCENFWLSHILAPYLTYQRAFALWLSLSKTCTEHKSTWSVLLCSHKQCEAQHHIECLLLLSEENERNYNINPMKILKFKFKHVLEFISTLKKHFKLSDLNPWKYCLHNGATASAELVEQAWKCEAVLALSLKVAHTVWGKTGSGWGSHYAW